MRRPPAKRTTVRLGMWIKPSAKERLRKYALELSTDSGRYVSMVKALEKLLLAIPLKATARRPKAA